MKKRADGLDNRNSSSVNKYNILKLITMEAQTGDIVNKYGVLFINLFGKIYSYSIKVILK